MFGSWLRPKDAVPPRLRLRRNKGLPPDIPCYAQPGSKGESSSSTPPPMTQRVCFDAGGPSILRQILYISALALSDLSWTKRRRPMSAVVVPRRMMQAFLSE